MESTREKTSAALQAAATPPAHGKIRATPPGDRGQAHRALVVTMRPGMFWGWRGEVCEIASGIFLASRWAATWRAARDLAVEEAKVILLGSSGSVISPLAESDPEADL